MVILLIDNEPLVRSALYKILEEVGNKLFEIYEANGVETGLLAIEKINPNIVFLDIEMDDGTGFDLLQKIPNLHFQLVITTAHNKYAIEAFKVSAIDYLLKPISVEAVIKSLEKAKLQINQQNLQQQVQILMQQLQLKTDTAPKKIVLKDIDNTYFITVNDILFCEAEGTYTRFNLENSNPILVSKNLKEYESVLEPMGFIRTHHSYLVNPTKVKLLDKKDTGSLILINGVAIPVSQRKREVVLKKLENL